MSIDLGEIRRKNTPEEAAAAWWIAALNNPKHDNGEVLDEITDLRLVVYRIQLEPLAPEHAEALFTAISANLRDRYELTSGYDSFLFGVDYDPDEFLKRCVYDSGFAMDPLRWSWKTLMQVSRDRVEVMHGYTAKWEIIWETPESPDVSVNG